MTRKKGRRRWITSGDKLTDWIFSRVIHNLNYKIEATLLKKNLREKHCKKTIELYGYIDSDVISLSAAKSLHPDREAIAKTLLHEVLHNVFCPIYERNIRRLEDLIWEKLSREQIAILKSYVPRHIVKNSYTA